MSEFRKRVRGTRRQIGNAFPLRTADKSSLPKGLRVVSSEHVDADSVDDICETCKAECTPSWKEHCDAQFDAIGTRDGFYLEEKPQRKYGFDNEKTEMYNVHMVDPSEEFNTKDVTIVAASEEDAIEEARSKAKGIVALGTGDPRQIDSWIITAKKEG